MRGCHPCAPFSSAFTENPYELTPKEHSEGGRARLVPSDGRRVCRFSGEPWQEGFGCACAAPSWNQLLFPGTATSLESTGTAVILGSAVPATDTGVSKST